MRKKLFQTKEYKIANPTDSLFAVLNLVYLIISLGCQLFCLSTICLHFPALLQLELSISASYKVTNNIEIDALYC